MVDREPTPQEALDLAREEVRGTERHFWALETGMMAWDEGTEDAEERAYQLAKARMYAAQARLAAAEAAVQAQQVTVPEAAERLGTSMDELAEAQEIVEADERQAAGEPEPASNFRDEHFKVVAVGGGAAPEAAERLRREIGEQVTVPEAAEQADIAMFDLAAVPEVAKAEDVAQAERQERLEALAAANRAKVESARAARAAQRAAHYGPHPQIPGMGMTQGFEREM